jgi:hypothetical protein
MKSTVGAMFFIRCNQLANKADLPLPLGPARTSGPPENVL